MRFLTLTILALGAVLQIAPAAAQTPDELISRGQINVGVRAAAYAARAGNTGTFTNAFANPAVVAGAKLGVYTITLTAPSTSVP